MGKKSPSPPAAPDPAATVAAQTAANKEAVRESALVNQINQVSPYGNITYTGDIGTPGRTQTLTLPPEVQAILSGQQRIGQNLTGFAEGFVPRVAQGLSTPFNTADVGVSRPTVTGQTRDQVAEALLGRLEPQFERDENRTINRLANQGIHQGSEAYTTGMDDLARARTDARLAVQERAGAEESRQYGLEKDSYQQALSDALLNRTQGLNEVSALIQGAPAMPTPQAPQPTQYQVAPADAFGPQALQYQGALNAYNQRVGSNNAMMGGLFGLGGALGSAAILASDRRLKTDIRRVGVLDSGLPVYTFRFKGAPMVHMGVMADEAETAFPESVVEIAGIKHVDYAQLH